MQKPDPEATASVAGLGDVRESVFLLAEPANRLGYAGGATDRHSFIQRENCNLGEADRELAPA
jgi:hypothetical protein